MAKFRNAPTKPHAQANIGPIATRDATRTFEGGAGFTRDPKSDLFLLAVTNMVGEDTFYEPGAKRDNRYRALVQTVTADDPEWVRRFIPWLRNEANMRTASIVAACEYIAARGEGGRQVLASACVRPDESAVALGYWLTTYGRKLPMPFKRGLADVLNRLNESGALKYDSQHALVRLGDVVELCHPKPNTPWRSELFRWLLDRRHHPSNTHVTTQLQTIQDARVLEEFPVEKRRSLLELSPKTLNDAGMTWERLSGWLPGGMDAQAWETLIDADLIPYMATLRNLHNFEKAGISATHRNKVIDVLTNPDAVALSRQFPYRFLSAYLNTETHTFSNAIEQALDLSCDNVPNLPGRTLVLVDISGSMDARLSARSKILRWQVGALFAGVAAKRFEQTDVALFATTSVWMPISKSASVLRTFDQVRGSLGSVGYGTNLHTAIATHFAGHDRVVIFTDDQAHDSEIIRPPLLHVFNLAGYAPSAFDLGAGRFEYGGFSDASFRQMALLESAKGAGWPF